MGTLRRRREATCAAAALAKSDRLLTRCKRHRRCRCGAAGGKVFAVASSLIPQVFVHGADRRSRYLQVQKDRAPKRVSHQPGSYFSPWNRGFSFFCVCVASPPNPHPHTADNSCIRCARSGRGGHSNLHTKICVG